MMKRFLMILVMVSWCNVGFAVTKEDGPIANFLDTFLGPTIVIVIIYFIIRKIRSKKK